MVPLLSSTRPDLRRKFRNWNVLIPRSTYRRDRINNPWAFIKLEFDKPEDNYKIVLHDMIVSYL